jgi:hypothetical protein
VRARRVAYLSSLRALPFFDVFLKTPGTHLHVLERCVVPAPCASSLRTQAMRHVQVAQVDRATKRVLYGLQVEVARCRRVATLANTERYLLYTNQGASQRMWLFWNGGVRADADVSSVFVAEGEWECLCALPQLSLEFR